MKILIVEDDVNIQDAFKLILEIKGHEVMTAENGKIALDITESNAFDAILLDYYMPIMDGKTFLKEYAQRGPTASKILVASNVSGKDIVEEMLELGASDMVLKADLSPNVLSERIERL